MKHSRFDYEYRANASKRHKLVGEILRNSVLFQNYQSYQEWPVDKINPKWTSGREHFDWVIPTLRLVIEVHGEQHYKPVQFGDMTAEESIHKFKEQKVRDVQKEQAAVLAGWTYIAIGPDVTVTADWILEQYREFFNPNKPVTKAKLTDWADKYKQAKKTYNNSNRAVDDRERALEYRKKQYQQMKEQKRKLKEKKNNV